MASKRVYSVAIVLAAIHLLAVGATAWYVSTSDSGQAPMIWVYWAFVDFPISLLYALLDNRVLIVHGALGTAWWFFLIILVGKLFAILKSAVNRGQ